MKVLLLSGSNSRNSGGLYNSVRFLGKSLLNIPHVKPVLLAHDDEYSKTDLPAYAPLKVETYSITGLQKFAFSFNLKNKINNISPCIIHLQCIWMYLSYVNLQYHKKTQTPYIISPRGMLDEWVLNTGRLQKKIAAFLYEKKHLSNAACIHALCEAEYYSIRKFGCKNPVAVIPNGVELPGDNNNASINLASWKYNDGRKSVLFLSRLHPKKGLEHLLRAWKNINYKNEWKLLIAGESADKNYLKTLYTLQSELELKKDVFFIGPQFHEQKDICFRSVHAFVLPSYSEGLPMAVLEAWSYKLPVLITYECNLPEGFKKNAAIKIKTDEENITAQLNFFFGLDENEKNQIGLNGYELVKQKFTWSTVALQMNEVYQWILNGGKVPDTIKFE